jgi:hypothetical protein
MVTSELSSCNDGTPSFEASVAPATMGFVRNGFIRVARQYRVTQGRIHPPIHNALPH